MKKLSGAQQKAMLVVRQNGGTLVANGIIASRHRVTFATLLSLERRGLLIATLFEGNWQFDATAAGRSKFSMEAK